MKHAEPFEFMMFLENLQFKWRCVSKNKRLPAKIRCHNLAPVPSDSGVG